MANTHDTVQNETHEETSHPDTVLVVDDEPDIRELIVSALSSSGILCHAASSIEESHRKLEEHDVSLAIVDLGLGHEDGMEIVKLLNQKQETAVLILSGKSDPIDRVVGIEVGADDYITKPFELRELVAKVKRHLVRVSTVRSLTRQLSKSTAEIGPWRLNVHGRLAEGPDGDAVRFSESEGKILEVLLENRGSVAHRSKLYLAINGHDDYDPMDRRVDVHVSNIRKKLGAVVGETIRTVHGQGYILDLE